MWNTLHTISLDYSQVPTIEQKHTMTVFLTVIGKLLPCITCREHYATYVHENPFVHAVQSAEELQRWLLGLHNTVNGRLGKSKYTFEQWYNEMTTRYGWLSSSSGKTNYRKIIPCSLVGILLICIAIYIYRIRVLRKR
jgi:hypothetical protein